ncbi:MAG: hypothetical protein E4G90_10670 [Gemmatimonadales bacterium]|nr:MAG: hypothetical protein E4G90_10670 [Gemmatimonadales bacterium]
MIRKLKILLVLAALGLSTGSASAFFENTVTSPRARAMGETSVAVPGAAFAAFLNPGQLAGVGQGAMAASYVQPFGLDFNDFFYLGGALPLDSRHGSLGLGVSSFQVESQSVSLLKETQITLAHGFTLYEDYHSRVDFGWGVSRYEVELGESIGGEIPGDATAYGVDLGMLMTLHKRTMLGFQIKNMNNPQIGLDQEELSRRLVAGLSYQPYDGVITTFEIQNQLDQDLQYHGGVEFYVVEGFALRAGVVTNPNKLTAGFGYELHDLGFDYGFSTGGGVLDFTHQFGMRFAWGGEAQ